MSTDLNAPVQTGTAVRLADGIIRVTAPNASLMTGPGTNSYIIGHAQCCVLDPGPDLAQHVEALVAAAPGAIRRIVLTHTHPDHSPAASRLKAATGASIFGSPAPADGRQDYKTRIDQAVRDGDVIGTEAERLLAIATPGHASNHLCYLHPPTGVLFSGDHILNGSTTVILAPDGDMTDYLASLHKLRRQPMTAIAPGHGALLTDPIAAVDALIAHRLRREAKTFERLRAAGSVSIDTLLPSVYDDVSPALYDFARCSLEAHLLKLEREGRVARKGELWSAGGAAG